MTAPLLRVRDLDVYYGSVQVLFGLDLDVHEGEIVTLLGTNGAGKSTLYKAVSGLLRPRRGSVEFAGTDITGRAANEIAQQGIIMMPGGRSVFPTLTVKENLRLAAWMKRRSPTEVRAAEERVLELFPRVRERYDQPAGNLSGGEQQMLAISQALIPDPKLLLIDELSLGLAPTIVGQLVDVLRQVQSTGVTMVVIEQSINVALEFAERAVFMEKGQFRFTGPTRDLLDRPDILRSVFISGAASLGDSGAPSPDGNGYTPRSNVVDLPVLDAEPTAPTPVLECHKVVKRFGGINAVDGASIELRRGEILGLIGQNGAGKTTLLDCVSGYLPIDSGAIVLNGTDITARAPHERAALGLGRSFQEARLYPSLTTAETIALARTKHLLSRSLTAAAFRQPVSRASEAAVADTVGYLIDAMGLGVFRDTPTGALSTGTRRIVELACVLAADPDVVVLDEPSGGVAQKETEAIGPLLKRIQSYTETSMLIIEHDMPLMTKVCDRMYAFELGAVIADGTPAEVLAHPQVIASYLGTNEAAINRSGERAKPRRRLAGRKSS